MTLSTTLLKKQYVGNGVTKDFAFPYKFPADTDLIITLTSIAGVETVKVLNTDYTVAGEGTESSGVVSMVVEPASGEVLTIYRLLPLLQTADLTNQQAYFLATLEDALDRLTMMVQQINDGLSRAVRVAASVYPAVNTELPDPEASKLIGWNAPATALENYDPGAFIGPVVYGSAKADSFVGDGSTVDFLLTESPGSLNNLKVFINGLRQQPTVDYTWDGNLTVTFTVAPFFNDAVFIQYQQALLQGSAEWSSISARPFVEPGDFSLTAVPVLIVPAQTQGYLLLVRDKTSGGVSLSVVDPAEAVTEIEAGVDGLSLVLAGGVVTAAVTSGTSPREVTVKAITI